MYCYGSRKAAEWKQAGYVEGLSGSLVKVLFKEFLKITSERVNRGKKSYASHEGDSQKQGIWRKSAKKSEVDIEKLKENNLTEDFPFLKFIFSCIATVCFPFEMQMVLQICRVTLLLVLLKSLNKVFQLQLQFMLSLQFFQVFSAVYSWHNGLRSASTNNCLMKWYGICPSTQLFQLIAKGKKNGF